MAVGSLEPKDLHHEASQAQELSEEGRGKEQERLPHEPSGAVGQEWEKA